MRASSRRVVTVEFRALTIGDRIYALLAWTFLGLCIAILGRGGVTIRSGNNANVTVSYE